MTTAEVCMLLDLKLPRDVFVACEWLESRGLQFCVDFGYENAIEKALELRRNKPSLREVH